MRPLREGYVSAGGLEGGLSYLYNLKLAQRSQPILIMSEENIRAVSARAKKRPQNRRLIRFLPRWRKPATSSRKPSRSSVRSSKRPLVSPRTRLGAPRAAA